MNNDTITVVRYNEDGDLPSVEQMTKAELRSRLAEDYYGPGVKFYNPNTDSPDTFVGLVVVGGHIIEPRPIKVALDWDFT